MKKGILLALSFICLCSSAYAAKTTYIVTNNKYNYVKLKEISVKEAELRAMTHPKKLDEEVLQKALATIRLSKRHLLVEKIVKQEVFDETALSFLVPNLLKAFEQASPTEEVVFSHLTKDPDFIFRKDLLTVASTWLEGDKLHISFNKLFARVLGDADNRGSRKKGVRIQLELRPGQTLSTDDNDELIIDLAYQATPEEMTAWEKANAAEDAEHKASETSSSKNEKPIKSDAASVSESSSVKERLKTLESLKKEGLINDEEYKKKREEILKSL